MSGFVALAEPTRCATCGAALLRSARAYLYGDCRVECVPCRFKAERADKPLSQQDLFGGG